MWWLIATNHNIIDRINAFHGHAEQKLEAPANAKEER